MASKKIAVVTGSRADFSHLAGILSEIEKAHDLELQLIVTGSHLSKKHGYTVEEIKAAGFKVHTEIDMELVGDSPRHLCGSMSLLMNKISEYFACYTPDCIMMLGDRYELLPIADAAVLHQIPIVHIHGGETTEGAIDEVIRHSITKMARLHFVATETYRRRVIQMGERSETVFNFGAPGLDNLRNIQFKSKADLENEFKMRFRAQNILVTYHPVTLSERETLIEVEALLHELAQFDPKQVGIFVTLPNADTYTSIVHDRLKKFLADHSHVQSYSNLGYINYLSLMKIVDLVAGNSSSGIIEAPFLGKAVVNLGLRQQGRITSEHVISVDSDKGRLHAAFVKGLNHSFQEKISKLPSLYGSGDACARIVEVLRKSHFEELRFKKFFDIDF